MDSTFLPIAYTRFGSVPKTTCQHVDRWEYCWSWVALALSDIEQGAISLILFHNWALTQLKTVFVLLYSCTIRQRSYCRLSFSSSECSFDLRLREMSAQVFSCVLVPRVSVVISNCSFPFVFSEYNVFFGGGSCSSTRIRHQSMKCTDLL